MKTLIVRLAVAAVLVAAGDAFRRAAAIEDRLAGMLVQQTTRPASVTPAAYDALDADVAPALRIPIVGDALRADLRRQRAAAAYWNKDYAAVATLATTADADEADTDAELAFLAANARVREVLQSGGTRQVMVQGLDEALNAYAGVLKLDASHTNAAHNYELVSRLRNALAAGNRTDRLMPSEQPSQQGQPGEPPQGTRPPDFNVIVPMRPDERQEQFDAGVGEITRRRG